MCTFFELKVKDASNHKQFRKMVFYKQALDFQKLYATHLGVKITGPYCPLPTLTLTCLQYDKIQLKMIFYAAQHFLKARYVLPNSTMPLAKCHFDTYLWRRYVTAWSIEESLAFLLS
jgi:hypothetical protein